MLERLKVLSGALSLDAFTVDQLAKTASVNPHTVRTVLERDQRFFQAAGEQRSGRRGGVSKLYEVVDERVRDLQEEVERVYRALPPNERGSKNIDTQSLDIAEEFLSDRFHKIRDSARRTEILEVAKQEIASFREDLRLHSGEEPSAIPEPVMQRLQVVEALRENCTELLEVQRRIEESRGAREKLEQQRHGWHTIYAAVNRLRHAPIIAAEITPDSAFAGLRDRGAFPDCEFVLLNAFKSAGLADIVGDILAQQSADFPHRKIHLRKLDLTAMTEPELHDIALKWASEPKSVVGELVFAVDSEEFEPQYLIETFDKLCTRIAKPIAWVVLDESYDPKLRNDVYRHRGIYAGHANELHREALTQVLNQPLQLPVVAGAMAATLL